ncbi:putative MFS-type transporter [Aestuariimicrobium sp. T2.26MG-19.2B]|nr:putative MFS-type transporter [Aestuariimicrobium sp. T2.26MG-19.2B]
MHFWRSIQRMARHPKFKRLLAVRIATQASDGTLQVGMASYVLFSPQSQPNAVAIAAVLAITLLPFSFLGPFASVVLDRWSRQRVVVWTDALRATIALSLAALVFTGDRSFRIQAVMFGLLLVAMSANRFLLAGLTAGLPYTVNKSEYLTASSIMPTIGPTGVLIGGAIAGGLRVALAPRYMQTHQADAIVFVVAALMFCTSVALAFGFGKHELGPEPGQSRPSVKRVLPDLREALSVIRHQAPIGIGLTTIFVARMCFGLISVGVILGYRNYFHTVKQVNAAMADIGLWGAFTGVGFVLSAVLVPPLAHRFGLRTTLMMLLLGSAVMQAIPGSIFHRTTLLIAAFGIGLFAQSIKIVVDTVCQIHVDDNYKGRVFVIYDMLFNAAIVAAAALAIFVLPADGFSHLVFIGTGVAYLLLAVWFWWQTGRTGGREAFDVGQHGSGSLVGEQQPVEDEVAPVVTVAEEPRAEPA